MTAVEKAATRLVRQEGVQKGEIHAVHRKEEGELALLSYPRHATLAVQLRHVLYLESRVGEVGPVLLQTISAGETQGTGHGIAAAGSGELDVTKTEGAGKAELSFGEYGGNGKRPARLQERFRGLQPEESRGTLQGQGGGAQGEIQGGLGAGTYRSTQAVGVSGGVLEDEVELGAARPAGGQVEKLQVHPLHPLALHRERAVHHHELPYYRLGRGARRRLPRGKSALQFREVPDACRVLLQVDAPLLDGDELEVAAPPQKVEPFRRHGQRISGNEVGPRKSLRCVQPDAAQDDAAPRESYLLHGEFLLECGGDEPG